MMFVHGEIEDRGFGAHYDPVQLAAIQALGQRIASGTSSPEEVAWANLAFQHAVTAPKNPSIGTEIGKTVVGAVSGAVTGLYTGGPWGAAVGAVAGGVKGHEQKKVNAVQGLLNGAAMGLVAGSVVGATTGQGAAGSLTKTLTGSEKVVAALSPYAKNLNPAPVTSSPDQTIQTPQNPAQTPAPNAPKEINKAGLFDSKNILIFLILGSLTAGGYLLFNKEKAK